MAAAPILKLLVAILSLPFVVWSRLLERLGLWQINSDVEECLNVVDSSTGLIPQSYVVALIAAEDHRSALHPGSDPIAIFRALFMTCIRRKRQGASTIEQQFVRVVSGRYASSFLRKVREQALAVAISRQRSKSSIAAAYLCVAFYGSRYIGLAGLKQRCGHDLAVTEPRLVLGMIARLKYPEPLRPTRNWHIKIADRVDYIAERLNRSANPAIETDAHSARLPRALMRAAHRER